MIKVLIVDDHLMVREGLTQLLEYSGKLEVIGQAGNGEECLEKIKTLNPDIVLLDINMPVMDGIEALEQIKRQGYSCKVILLTIHNEVDYLIRCNELQCEGYILKDSDVATLESAIFSVYEGNRYLEPKLAPLLNNTLINRDKDLDKLKSLTKREVDVLKLIAKGMLNREIAEDLHISERTVKNHISNIFKKIDATDRTQAAVFAIKYNIIKIQ